MSILPFRPSTAFDSETTHLLGSAFETAWERLKKSGATLGDESETTWTRELLARRIIATAERGERSHNRLVEDALDYLLRSQTALDRPFEPPKVGKVS